MKLKLNRQNQRKIQWVNHRGFLLLFIIIAMLALVTSCTNLPAQDQIIQPIEVTSSESDSYEIVVVLQSEPGSLDWNDLRAKTIPVSLNIYEPLVTRNSDGDLEPLLAESWERMDDNTWRFYLRQGVNFHDGQSFDANTVATYADFFSTAQEWIGQISFEVIDTYTLDIRTELPDPILPARLYWLFLSASSELDPNQEIVGTGPYKLETWNPGENIILLANPDYWGGEPAIKKVTFIWREDAPLRLAMFRAEDVDIAQALLPGEDPSIRLSVAEIPETPFIKLFPIPPLDDIRVRRAICIAIDREAMTEQIFSGFARPATQLITPDVTGYNPNILLRDYNPEQARAFIEEARNDGVPVDLEITLFAQSGTYPQQSQSMEFLQLWFAEIGLNVRLEETESSVRVERLSEIVASEAPYISMSSHGNEGGDAIFTMGYYYHSTGGGVTFSNAVLDDLLTTATPLTGETRQEALAEIMAYQHDEIVQDCSLVHLQSVWGVSDRINWEPRFDGLILVKTISIE